MRILKVFCTHCGYQGEIIEGECINECPICSTQGSLQLTQRQRDIMMKEKIRAHILEGFKSFGIEKTIEDIETFQSNHMKEMYAEIIKEISKGKLRVRL